MGDEFATESDGDGTAGKGTSGDGVIEDVERVAKSLVLAGGIAQQGTRSRLANLRLKPKALPV